MIIVKTAVNAPIYLEILLKVHGVDEMKFDNESQAISYLENIKFKDCEIFELRFIRI